MKQHIKKCRAYSSEEKEKQELPGTPQAFKVRAKHPKGKEIEDDVEPAPVKKKVGDRLPEVRQPQASHQRDKMSDGIRNEAEVQIRKIPVQQLSGKIRHQEDGGGENYKILHHS